jgi:thioredoxin-related protein
MKQFLKIIFLLVFGSLQAQEWQSSFDQAVDLANKENKPIILVFSGSDWCAPCIRLEKKIWQSEEFKLYAGEHYVLYKADFPKKKKNELPLELSETNTALAQKFNPKGHFPLVVVLDKDQSVLGKTGFNVKASPKKYISILNGFIP